MIVQIPTLHNIDHLRDEIGDQSKLYAQSGKVTPEFEKALTNYGACCVARIKKGIEDD